MIPRFRAFIKKQETFVEPSYIISIDFRNEELQVQNIYFVYGLPGSRDLEYYRFDEIELMQSIGLKDHNGLEIFEGDILRHRTQTEYTFIVKYDKEYSRWIGDGINCIYNINIAKDFVPYYEIIGNIYQNKELLKEK